MGKFGGVIPFTLGKLFDTQYIWTRKNHNDKELAIQPRSVTLTSLSWAINPTNNFARTAHVIANSESVEGRVSAHIRF